MNSAFRIEYVNCPVDHVLEKFFSRTVMSDVRLFNIPVLPLEFRIHVRVLTIGDFEQYKKMISLNEYEPNKCWACTDPQIHAVSYHHLKGRIDRSSYLKMIRHECIHVLQHLSSRVPSTEMIWLYESIACALSKQRKALPVICPTWRSFAGNFYAIPDCYAVAYHFGTALLQACSLDALILLT